MCGVDESIADALYAVGPKDFVSARDARAKELKDAGDKEAAAEVKALRRPTVAAWLANQLVREHADEMTALLDLGAALREATATLSGPELRQLSRQRNEVVQALVRQARRLALADGQPVADDASRGLEDTLNAALADEAAAETVMTGRLTEALRHTGFAAGTGSAAPARSRPAAQASRPPSTERGTKAGAAGPTAAERRAAERRERLEHDLAAAQADAREAADALTAAEEAAAAAGAAAEHARAQVDDLRARLDSAEAGLRTASEEQQRTTSAQGRAATAADKASARVRTLQQDLASP